LAARNSCSACSSLLFEGGVAFARELFVFIELGLTFRQQNYLAGRGATELQGKSMLQPCDRNAMEIDAVFAAGLACKPLRHTLEWTRRFQMRNGVIPVFGHALLLLENVTCSFRHLL
jgi:hypothetical protein